MLSVCSLFAEPKAKDMSTFQNVRKRLNGCRPFAWYLKRFKAVYEDAGLIPARDLHDSRGIVDGYVGGPGGQRAMGPGGHGARGPVFGMTSVLWTVLLKQGFRILGLHHQEQSGMCLHFLGPAGTSGSGSEGVKLPGCIVVILSSMFMSAGSDFCCMLEVV